MLIIISNTKYKSSIIIFHNTLQQISLVLISRRQVDVGYKKINNREGEREKEREASLYNVTNFNNVIQEKEYI